MNFLANPIVIEKPQLPLIHKFGKDPINIYSKTFSSEFGVRLAKKKFL